MEGFGEGADDWGFVSSVGTHMVIGEIPIREWGTEQQKKKYLPKMCAGEWVGAFALTEPDAGFHAASIRTKAEKKGGDDVLNGSKTFIANAPVADVIVVFATQDRSKGRKGISAFLVEKGFSGLSTTNLEKMGLKAIQHKLADMKVWLEMSRLMFHRVAWKKNRMPALFDASIAKVFFAETNREAALNASVSPS